MKRMPIMTLLALAGKAHWYDRLLECIPFLLMVKGRDREDGIITFRLDYNAILQAVIIVLLGAMLTQYYVRDDISSIRSEVASLRAEVTSLEQKTNEQSGIMRQMYLRINEDKPDRFGIKYKDR